jgi:hypothetical protein
MEKIKQYLDKEGLQLFWNNIKKYYGTIVENDGDIIEYPHQVQSSRYSEESKYDLINIKLNDNKEFKFELRNNTYLSLPLDYFNDTFATKTTVDSLNTLINTNYNSLDKKIDTNVDNLDNHILDNKKHITDNEREQWNRGQANQNAFSNLIFGESLIAANKPEDSITLAADKNIGLNLNTGTNTLSFSLNKLSLSDHNNNLTSLGNVNAGSVNQPVYFKNGVPTTTNTFPTKLSQLTDDIVEGNYLPMAESTYDTTDTTNVLKHDGSWGIPELAEDLGGREETHHEEFFFQPTAGNDLSIKDGYAKIKSLKGNTIVWNQLASEEQLLKANFWTINKQGNEYICTNPIESNYRNLYCTNQRSILNHKYYININIVENTVQCFIRINSVLSNWEIDSFYINSSSLGKHSVIINRKNTNYTPNFWNIQTSNGTNPNGILRFKDLTIIDLTQMFGEGNEPTIEEFEAMYPNNYYEYNKGVLRNLNGTYIKSVGFNQFNANSNEIIKYSVINADGTLSIRNETSTIKKYSTLSNIKIFPNTTYYVHNIPDGYAQRAIALYDINKIFTRHIDISHGNNNNHLIEGKTSFTTLENEHYCTLGFIDANKQNVCLNLSHSGYRNGQYEPYKESILQLPIKTIRDSKGNLLFPDGLKSAGTAYDEIVYDEGLGKYKAIQRIGSIDMGTLNGQYYSVSENYPYGYFAYYNFNSRKKGKNVLCSKYVTSYEETFKNDKNLVGSTNFNTLYIIDSLYTDFATFKQSLKGEILYYELEIPIEVILDNIDLSYRAWDFGTEELIADEFTTPIIAETKYNFNAVDMIRNNYFAIKQLKESNPLTNLATVAHTGEYSDLNGKPDSLKNPHALTITKDDDNTVYDGSESRQIFIPTKTSDLNKDDVFTKTETFDQTTIIDLINKAKGDIESGESIIDTWRPIIVKNNSGIDILTLESSNINDNRFILKAGNNIELTKSDNIISINNTYKYTLPAANETILGGIKSGEDLTIINGVATVVGLSEIRENVNKGVYAYGWGNHTLMYPGREGQNASGTWEINITGNAAKLTTPRTLWGQSFDGSANVSGNMTNLTNINNNVKFSTITTNVALLNIAATSATINYMHLYVTSNNSLHPNSRPLVLQYGYGNVGIGVEQPSEKLEVNGNIKATTFKGNLDWSYIQNKPEIPKSFTITANATDDDVVILTGSGDANSISYDAKHTQKGPSSGYTSGNTTTSISGTGGTIKIPQITVDKYGHVTAATDESVTITMPTIPSSLKNPYSLTIQSNGTNIATYDGSYGITANIQDIITNRGISIQSTANLNDETYLTPNYYYSSSASVSDTLSNSPFTGVGFRIISLSGAYGNRLNYSIQLAFCSNGIKWRGISVNNNALVPGTWISLGSVSSIKPGTGLTGTNSDTAITTSGTINLKTASDSEIGGIKLGYTTSSIPSSTIPLQIDSNNKAYVNLNNTAIVTGLGYTPLKTLLFSSNNTNAQALPSQKVTIKAGTNTSFNFSNSTNSLEVTINSANVPIATTTTYGVVLPAASTTDTEYALNYHKNCYHAVQINGDGKLVVNIPKVYTVFKEISAITIGEKSKIVYTNTTTPSMTVELKAGLKNSCTHLYVINNLNKPITITFKAKNVVGPTSIASSSSSGISVDLYVTDDGTIVIEPNNAN